MRKPTCLCGSCVKCTNRIRKKEYLLKKKAQAVARKTRFPVAISIWETSDGRQFSAELEACRWELDLFIKG